MSNIIGISLLFAFSCFVIGLKYSCYNLNQSGAVLKTVVTWSRVFSRARGLLLFFILRSYWLSEIFPSLYLVVEVNLVLVLLHSI